MNREKRKKQKKIYKRKNVYVTFFNVNNKNSNKKKWRKKKFEKKNISLFFQREQEKK